MSDRKVFIVDVETTGLDPEKHVPIEVAVVGLDEDVEFSFFPFVQPDDWANLDPVAMMVNRYFERGGFHGISHGTTNWAHVWNTLRGNTLAGSNPSFDARMLGVGYLRALNGSQSGGPSTLTPWHYRMPDIASYAAPALGLAPDSLEGLAFVCDELEVVNDAPHTALGDARATAECFRILRRVYQKSFIVTPLVKNEGAPNA